MDRSPLCQAIRNSNATAAKLLLDFGADPNRVEPVGAFPSSSFPFHLHHHPVPTPVQWRDPIVCCLPTRLGGSGHLAFGAERRPQYRHRGPLLRRFSPERRRMQPCPSFPGRRPPRLLRPSSQSSDYPRNATSPRSLSRRPPRRLMMRYPALASRPSLSLASPPSIPFAFDGLAKGRRRLRSCGEG
jgi:hypothetical protein